MQLAFVKTDLPNTTDFEYERTMEATNHRIYPALTTVMLFTPSAVADISSSTVREVICLHGMILNS